MAYRSNYVTGILNMTMLLARDGRYDEVTSLHQNAVRVLDDALLLWPIRTCTPVRTADWGSIPCLAVVRDTRRSVA